MKPESAEAVDSDTMAARAVLAWGIERRFGLSAAEAALLLLAAAEATIPGAEGIQKRALQIWATRDDLSVARVGTLAFIREAAEAFPDLLRLREGGMR